jgi:hypothetical protein
MSGYGAISEVPVDGIGRDREWKNFLAVISPAAANETG